MSRRMIPQKDQDYIEVLSTALTADIAGDVEVYQNVEVASNAQVDGNAVVGGDLHVGGKLLTSQPSQIQIGNFGPTLPDFPTNAGTYVLKLTVDANGHATFAWIAA